MTLVDPKRILPIMTSDMTHRDIATTFRIRGGKKRLRIPVKEMTLESAFPYSGSGMSTFISTTTKVAGPFDKDTKNDVEGSDDSIHNVCHGNRLNGKPSGST